MKQLLHRLFFPLFLSASLVVSSRAQIITTIVSGTNVNDGGPATNAALNAPTGLAFDGAGNLYITDGEENSIRKVDNNGRITTAAGPATSAQLYSPAGIAISAAGVIYIADKINNRIRKIDAVGQITTIAGTGTSSPTDVYLNTVSELLIVDSGNGRIRKVATNGTITTIAGNGTRGFGGDGGPATSASFSSPTGIVQDAGGNIYITDSANNRIRKIDNSGVITTIAGSGASGNAGDGGLATQAAIGSPAYLTVDASGVLYVTQSGGWIRRIDTKGTISTIAGTGMVDFSGDGGPAAQAALNKPAGIRVNASGDIFVADQNNYRIRKISGGIISTIAGGFTGDGGPAMNAYLRIPSIGLGYTATNTSVDQLGNVYVTDRYAGRVRKVTPSGIISTFAGTGVFGYTGDSGPATQAKLSYPRGVATDQTGNTYLVDQFNTRIRKIDANQVITTIAGSGKSSFIADIPTGSSIDLYNTTTLPIDQVGNLYAFSSCCVIKVAPVGTITVVAGTTVGAGFSGDGGPAVNARLSSPSSAFIDANNVLYIADGGNNRIRKVDASGIITTIAGTGEAGYGVENVSATSTPLAPFGITRDVLGNLYISEPRFSRIRKIDPNGIISTVAGTGGFSGANGPIPNAGLNVPYEITLDAAGNLYIADAGNRRVQKFTYPVQVLLTAGTSCSATSVTLTALPTGPGFSYQFGPGATQIGTSNQATVSNAGVYSVTVSTSIFGSPPGSTTISVGGPGESYTLRDGSWNDPTIWSCGAVPTAGQSARIGHLVDIPDDYQATVGSIRYNNGGHVRFNARSRLTLAD